MDDTEDDARYPPKPYPVNYRQTFGSSHRQKLPVRNASFPSPMGNDYDDEDDEEEEQKEEEEEENERPVHNCRRRHHREEEEEEEVEVEEERQGEEEEDEDEEEENGIQRIVEEEEEDEEDHYRRINIDEEEEESEPQGKKQRLEKSGYGYEFVPRLKAPLQPSVAVVAPASKPSSFGGRNSPVDWSEQATFALLDAWGDRFLQLGRKSLRSDEWLEVAKKVSQVSKTARTDTQCRNRLDTLKKKYKKEKMRMSEAGNYTSKWVYFRKMDMLMTSSPRQPGLSCGLDSGEYVFMNPRVYLNRSNGLDEMRDSPGNSETSGDDEGGSDGLPPTRHRLVNDHNDGGSSYRLLADSIQKFGEIYEKIESSKRQQMMELEKMRMEFHRDLEIQKRQILERAQVEIEKIRQGDDEEIDVSVENISS